MPTPERMHSGLRTESGSVPLAGVRIDASVQSRCSRVTVTQRYRNVEDRDVEAVYVFPLEEGAAVCGFAALVDGVEIEGRVEEREKAFEKYDDAMADGHGAFLLDQERPNVFTASIGNLRPGTEVEVRISYVALLNYEGDAIRLMLPTTVSPRYVPADLPPEVGQPDGERVNPEAWPAVPYGLTLEVDIDAGSGIRGIESPSHAVRTQLDGERARVNLSREEAALDRDFVLLIETQEPTAPRARVARESDGTRVAMVTFHPGEELVSREGNEVIFVLDCSGSMHGTSIVEARRALDLCIRSLTEGDSFNIVRFGSTHESMWEHSRGFDQKALDEAAAWLKGASANLGGTEILAPLQEIAAKKADGKRARQILLLTDGQVSNEEEVIALARDNRDSMRIFSFGIGAGSSEFLARGVARASGGAAEFIHPGERIEAKVLRMFRRVGSRAFEPVSVGWGGLDVEQAPTSVPTLFAGDAVTVFARVKSGDARQVTLTAGEHSWSLPIDLELAPEDPTIPTLWGRERIRDIEEGNASMRGSRQRQRRDKRVHSGLVEIGKRYGLMSSATSYVAIEVRREGEKSDESVLRRVPVALTDGWGGLLSRRIACSAPPGLAMRRASAHRSASLSDTGVFSIGMSAEEPDGSSYIEELRVTQDEAGGFASSAPPTDPLLDLLMTQRADGSFRKSAAFRELLAAHMGAINASIRRGNEAVVVTAVIVRYLELYEGDRYVVFQAALKKAKKWLRRQEAFDAATILA